MEPARSKCLILCVWWCLMFALSVNVADFLLSFSRHSGRCSFLPFTFSALPRPNSVSCILLFFFFFTFLFFLFSASDSRSLRWHVLNHLAISSQEALAGWWCGSRRPSSTVAHSGTKSLKFGVTDQEESSFRNFCTRIRDIKLLTSHNGAGRPEHPTVSLC